ncbi:hypothetical protein FACS1894199_07930 [Bacteroidia bacterium]|nr:hypothetical protein FACS1894199_07930 [Bacteroidia bacterium]
MSTIELDATKATLARKILNETNQDVLKQLMVFFDNQGKLTSSLHSSKDPLQKHQAQKPSFGCMKGTFTWMSDDFNAPLEDFKEYM